LFFKKESPDLLVLLFKSNVHVTLDRRSRDQEFLFFKNDSPDLTTRKSKRL